MWIWRLYWLIQAPPIRCSPAICWNIWESNGEWQQEFELGDLTRKAFDIGIATLGIEDRERQCPVMFGPEGEGLLGATTLEIFSLGVDPVHQQLVSITPRARAI